MWKISEYDEGNLYPWGKNLKIYLDGPEPMGDGGPGEEDDGPGQDGPRGPEADHVDGAEGDGRRLGGVGGNGVAMVNDWYRLDEDSAEEVGHTEVAEDEVVGEAEHGLLLPDGGHDHEVEDDAGDGQHHLGDDKGAAVVDRLGHVVAEEVHHGRHGGITGIDYTADHHL